MIIGLLGLPALLWGQAPEAWGMDSWLQQRLDAWPNWQLPAPLPRPRAQQDLVYPSWFEGSWSVESTDLDDHTTLRHPARFGATSNSRGAVVGDRSFNARAIGKAVLGAQLLGVEQAPDQVNRQLARLSQDRQLETTVIGRRESPLDQPSFLSDELVLQILHGPGAPRISRIETLSRYQLCDPLGNAKTEAQIDAPISATTICAEQWQARYGPPGDTLSAQPLHVNHYALRLTKQQDPIASIDLPADPATQTRAGAVDGR